MKYFFSIVISCCLSIVGYSQKTEPKEKKKPVEVVIVDTVKTDYRPTGIRVAVDLINVVRNQVETKFNGWEVNTDLDFDRYYLTVDYGSWAKQLPIQNGNFENSGNYFRVGADVNFLLKDPDKNMVFLGYRYGKASFDHSTSYLLTQAVPFNSTLETYTDKNVSARWMELTGGLRIKIWKMIWMGYTARFKFSPKAKDFTNVQPFDIPGYGIFEKKIYWGFNYQLFFRIPVRKQEKPLPAALPK